MTSPASPRESHTWNASISTMWAGTNLYRLNHFCAAARQLGFAKIELNHQVNSSMLDGLDLSQVQFSSIHEPCPADISPETLKERDWLISAQDENNRCQGVEAIKRSIELAHSLRAHTIVVHAGNVLVTLSQEREMRFLFESGLSSSCEYQALLKEDRQNRAAQVGPRLNAVRKSLDELLQIASVYGIRLGLENRYHYMDIPSPDELDILLKLAGPDQLGFIYDAGHAQALDRLGFFPQMEWLDRFSTRIIGTHLHDAVGVKDHRTPGSGEVDFGVLASYLPEGAFRTLELQPKTTAEQIQAGILHLLEHNCIGYLE